MTADLEYAVVVANRTLHCQSFGNGVGKRFLAVNVLAGLAGMNSNKRMPVIGSGDFDYVDVLAVEHVFVELIRVASRGNFL